VAALQAILLRLYRRRPGPRWRRRRRMRVSIRQTRWYRHSAVRGSRIARVLQLAGATPSLEVEVEVRDRWHRCLPMLLLLLGVGWRWRRRWWDVWELGRKLLPLRLRGWR
jgi:hypothetical protein